jgi:hypothetical protein
MGFHTIGLHSGLERLMPFQTGLPCRERVLTVNCVRQLSRFVFAIGRLPCNDRAGDKNACAHA